MSAVFAAVLGTVVGFSSLMLIMLLNERSALCVAFLPIAILAVLNRTIPGLFTPETTGTFASAAIAGVGAALLVLLLIKINPKRDS